jgi:hypothetical protein
MASDNVSVGETISFGGCEWRVLDIQGKKALILSNTTLGNQLYHNKHDFVTWAECDLRKSLNEKLYNIFDSKEKMSITDTTVTTSDNPRFGTSGGTSTVDKVFLLSIEEVVRYFGDSGQIQNKCSQDIRPIDECIDDEYNNARISKDHYVGGIYEWWRNDGTNSAWWLRSPGGHGTCTAYVNESGKISIFGDSSIPEYKPSDDGQIVKLGVRPALWLNIDNRL